MNKPNLEELIKMAQRHIMSPEEKEAQRRSWVMAEIMLEHPHLDRDVVEQIYDKAHASYVEWLQEVRKMDLTKRRIQL